MECSQPVRVKDPNTGEYIYVRCRHCYECLQNRSSEWVSRLLLEREAWSDTYFFTLTYDNEHVPWNMNHTRMVVSPDHVSKFVNGLRQRFQQGFFHIYGNRLELPDTKFKYYITSEYGSKEHTFRPHYHGILYINCSDEHLLYCLFLQVWGKGFIDFQAAGERAAGYVSKYLVKYTLDEEDKQDDFIIDEEGEKVFAPRTRCFSHMSKGIGAGYFEHTSRLDWHREDPVSRGYIPMPGGVKLPMPRYFTQQIFDDDMRQQRAAHQAMLAQKEERSFARLSLDKQKVMSREEVFAHLERVRQAKAHYQKKSNLHKL